MGGVVTILEESALGLLIPSRPPLSPAPPVQPGHGAPAIVPEAIHRPPPRRHRHRCSCRWGPLPFGHRPDAHVLGPRPPFPGPKGKPGDGTPTPLSYMLGPDLMPFSRRIPFLFSGEVPAEDPPRVMGPKPKNFKLIFALAASRSGQDHVQPRGTLSLGLTIPLKKRDTLSTA